MPSREVSNKVMESPCHVQVGVSTRLFMLTYPIMNVPAVLLPPSVEPAPEASEDTLNAIAAKEKDGNATIRRLKNNALYLILFGQFIVYLR